MREWFSYPNRTLCDALEELRKQIRYSDSNERQKSSLMSLCEEIQTYANRMEASLSDLHDIRKAHQAKKELSQEIKLLQQKVSALKQEIKEQQGVVDEDHLPNDFSLVYNEYDD